MAHGQAQITEPKGVAGVYEGKSWVNNWGKTCSGPAEPGGCRIQRIWQTGECNTPVKFGEGRDDPF